MSEETEPARGKRGIVELRAEHARLHGPKPTRLSREDEQARPPRKERRYAEPQLKVSAELIARLFRVPVELVEDPNTAAALPEQVASEGGTVTPYMVKKLDQFLDEAGFKTLVVDEFAQHGVKVSDVETTPDGTFVTVTGVTGPPITPELIAELRANPGLKAEVTAEGVEVTTESEVVFPGAQLTQGDDAPPAVGKTDAENEDDLYELWNAFSIDVANMGQQGAADKYRMEDLQRLADFNGVDVKGLRKKVDVVAKIFA